MKRIAISRVLVDNVDTIQVDWALYGPKLAQVALTFGADDIDSVSPEDDDVAGPAPLAGRGDSRGAFALQASSPSSATARFETSATSMLIRLGAVSYLNTRPLVHGLERADRRFSLRFDVPARCADLLHANEVDLGLIPSIEYPGTRLPDCARRVDRIGRPGCVGGAFQQGAD